MYEDMPDEYSLEQVKELLIAISLLRIRVDSNTVRGLVAGIAANPTKTNYYTRLIYDIVPGRRVRAKELESHMKQSFDYI